MPDSSRKGLLPGASGEQVLRSMLPLVVEVATKSAEGQTSVAAALGSLEAQVAELKAVVQENTTAVKQLVASKAAEVQQKEETGKWLRALLRPETLYYTVLIILTALGIRTTIPEQVLGQQLPAQVQSSSPKEAP